MRRASILLLASFGVALSACTTKTTAPPTAAPVARAAPTGGAAQTAANNGLPDPNQIVCKREEVTGSRLAGARECHTRAEWAQINATGMDRLQMLGAPGPTPTQTAAQAGNGP